MSHFKTALLPMVCDLRVYQKLPRLVVYFPLLKDMHCDWASSLAHKATSHVFHAELQTPTLFCTYPLPPVNTRDNIK